MIDEVGLTEDILRMGLNTVLTESRHGGLAEKLVEVRREFQHRWAGELARDVEFFDSNQFLFYTDISENITFGFPIRPEYEPARLAGNKLFREFLSEQDLMTPLLELGREIAVQTVSLLEALQDDQFFFELSPIPRDEFDLYRALVGRINKVAVDRLSRKESEAILRLALRFRPSQHKMATLPMDLQLRIIAARQDFVEKIGLRDPGAFSFYHPDDYLYTHSILENILFGHPRADHSRAVEEIQDRVVDLLREEKVFDEVMEAGLGFEVGSMGDRLSGGQKQKIAIARVFLKKPNILILDEATASLDNRSQAKIQELINSQWKGKSTLVAVVHRLELVKEYDRIVVLKAGRIVEMGRYQELLEQKGFFYELARGK